MPAEKSAHTVMTVSGFSFKNLAKRRRGKSCYGPSQEGKSKSWQIQNKTPLFKHRMLGACDHCLPAKNARSQSPTILVRHWPTHTVEKSYVNTHTRSL
jgi:hypothetical protein